MLSNFPRLPFSNLVYYLAAGLFATAGILCLVQKQKHELAIYLMPQCPFGVAALKQALNVYSDNSACTKLKIGIIGFERTTAATTFSNGETSRGCKNLADLRNYGSLVYDRFASLHGNDEVLEGLRFIAMEIYWPSQRIAYLKRYADKPIEDWKSRCDSLGIDPSKMESSIHSPETIERYATTLRDAVNRGITTSPTLFFDSRQIGCTDAAYECIGLYVHRQLSEGVSYFTGKNTIFLINPRECAVCKKIYPEQFLKPWRDKIHLEEVDLESPQAQKIIQSVRIKEFPILAIPRSLIKDAWAREMVDSVGVKGNDDYIIISLSSQTLPFFIYGKVFYDHDKVTCNLRHKDSAILLQHNGFLNDALREYWKALEISPADSQIWNNLGTIYDDKLHNTKIAVACYSLALEKDGNYGSALYNLVKTSQESNDRENIEKYATRYAWSMAHEHRFVQAQDYFTLAHDINPNAYDINKGLGWSLVELNQPQEALPYLIFCKDHSVKDDGDIWHLLGGAYFRLGDETKSEEAYSHAIEIESNRDSAETVHNLLYLYKKHSEWKKMLELIDKNNDENDFEMEIYKSLALWGSGDKARSLTQLLKARARFPNTASKIDYLLAQDYAYLKDRTQVEHYLDQCYAELTDSSLPLDESLVLADIAYNFNRLVISKAFLDHALSLQPAKAEIHVRLARISHLEKDFSKEKDELTLVHEFGG